MGLRQSVNDYSPTKTTLFWGIVGAAVVTMIGGFTLGGWVTGGTAAKMAEDAARDARAQLAATVCVERFVKANDAAAQLASLKETGRWQQKKFIEEGNWTIMPGTEKPVNGAADLCAAQLVEMELPAADATVNIDSTIQ